MTASTPTMTPLDEFRQAAYIALGLIDVVQDLLGGHPSIDDGEADATQETLDSVRELLRHALTAHSPIPHLFDDGTPVYIRYEFQYGMTADFYPRIDGDRDEWVRRMQADDRQQHIDRIRHELAELEQEQGGESAQLPIAEYDAGGYIESVINDTGRPVAVLTSEQLSRGGMPSELVIVDQNGGAIGRMKVEPARPTFRVLADLLAHISDQLRASGLDPSRYDLDAIADSTHVWVEERERFEASLNRSVLDVADLYLLEEMGQ